MKDERERRPSREVPEEIRDALDRFRWRVRGLRFLRGAGITAALGTILFGLSLWLDALLILPPAVRISLTLGTLGAVLVTALIALVLPILRPIPDLRAAWGIERAAPVLEEGLVSTLELLSGDPPGASARLVDAVARSAAGKVQALEVVRLLSPRSARLGLLGALAALAVLLVAAALDFRSFSMMANRFLHPREDLPRPTSVGIRVFPGNAILGLDDDLAIEVTVVRGRPGEVRLRSRVPGGEWRVAEMEPRSPPAVSEFRHEFRRARQTFEYQVIAGDASSPVYRVEVRERPRPELFTVTYRYPSYTRRPPATVSSPRGDLAAVSGTVSDIEVICMGRPAIARLSERGAQEPQDLTVEETSDGRSSVKAQIEIRRSGSYNLYLEDRGGVSNRGGESYSIQAEADRPPRVRILAPKTLEVVVEDAGRLEIQYQAQDDFGIEDLAVLVGTGEGASADDAPGKGDGERRFPIPLESEDGRGKPLFTGTYRLDIAALGLRPGESIPFRVVAKDGLAQTGSSPEMVLRMAFLPDPPEGAEWMAGLKEIQRGFDRAIAAWAALIDPPGTERAPAFAIDPARADGLGRSGEDLLKELSRLRGLGEMAASLGRSIPIPSVNRPAFGHLGAVLRRFTEEEGKRLWSEILASSGRIREALRQKEKPDGGKSGVAEAPSGPLYAALDQGSAKLARIAGQFTAIHRAERLETALDRLRALISAEEEIASRIRDLAGGMAGAPGPASGGASPPAPSQSAPPALPKPAEAGPGAPDAPWGTLARQERSLRIEAVSLGAELDGLAKLGGPEDPQLVALARSYLESVVPAMEAALRNLEARDPAASPGAIEAVAKAFQVAESACARELLRAGEAARAARSGLVPASDIARRLAALSAAEAQAASALETKGPEGAAEAAAGDRARQEEIIIIRSDLETEAEASEKAQPPDFESAADLVTLRDIFRDLSEGALGEAARRTEEFRAALADPGRKVKPSAEDLKPAVADRRRSAEVLDGLSKAYAGIEPGARLGAAARLLDAIAETEESIAWQLRSTPKTHARALRVRSGIQRELGISLDEIRASLEGLSKGLPEGPAKLLAGALTEIPLASKAAAEGAAACLALDPPKALAAALEAGKRAGEAALRADDVRASLPGLAAARAWIQRQIGSLPDRVERIAQEERAHGEILKRILLELGGTPAVPQQPERLSALGVDQDLLREECNRLAGQISREAGRLASAPVASARGSRGSLAASIHHLDLASGRILETSRGPMARSSKAIDLAARSTEPARQRDLLGQAAADEDRAAEELLEVAKTLRLLDQKEVVELQGADLEKLLQAPAPQGTDAASVKRALEEARALLEGVVRAAEVLSLRLPESVLKTEVLDRLRKSAEKFREAIEAGKAGDGPRAVALVGEGRSLLGEAVALVRRIRGEADAGLARAEAEGEEGEEKKPMSRELQEVYAELQRIQSLREWQGQIQADIDELLREPSAPGAMEKLKELAKMQEALVEELGARFLTTSELVKLVADLLSAGNEAKRIAEGERGLRGEAAAGKDDPSLAARLRERQEALAGEGAEMAKVVKAAGAVLTINLPQVLKPFWEAEAHLEPALSAMGGALSALGQAQMQTADEDLRKAAVELGVLVDLLGIARQKALEEIAQREEENSTVDFSQMGMEAALDALKKASQELSMGNPQAARSLQRSAMRGILSAAEALRARMDRMRLEPGQEAFFLSRILDDAAKIPGLSWEVLIRGDEPEGKSNEEGKADDASAESSDAFPEEYRELVRIYLRALAGER